MISENGQKKNLKMKSVEDSLGIWNAGLIWIHDKKDAGTAELERARNMEKQF